MLHASTTKMVAVWKRLSQLCCVPSVFLSHSIFRFELAKYRYIVMWCARTQIWTHNMNVAKRPLNRMLEIWTNWNCWTYIFFCAIVSFSAYFLHQCFFRFTIFIFQHFYPLSNGLKEKNIYLLYTIGSTRNTKVESFNFHLLLAQNLWMSKTQQK